MLRSLSPLHYLNIEFFYIHLSKFKYFRVIFILSQDFYYFLLNIFDVNGIKVYHRALSEMIRDTFDSKISSRRQDVVAGPVL